MTEIDDNIRDYIESLDINSLAVVRAQDLSKARVALYDLMRYAHLNFADKAKIIEPVFADNILINVMKIPLKKCCKAATVVPLIEEAGLAIKNLVQIHPPAHIIIVSPRHEIFTDLVNYVDILPEIDINLKTEYNYEQQIQANYGNKLENDPNSV